MTEQHLRQWAADQGVALRKHDSGETFDVVDPQDDLTLAFDLTLEGVELWLRADETRVPLTGREQARAEAVASGNDEGMAREPDPIPEVFCTSR